MTLGGILCRARSWLDDPDGSLPTRHILWFCDMLAMFADCLQILLMDVSAWSRSSCCAELLVPVRGCVGTVTSCLHVSPRLSSQGNQDLPRKLTPAQISLTLWAWLLILESGKTHTITVGCSDEGKPSASGRDFFVMKYNFRISGT